MKRSTLTRWLAVTASVWSVHAAEWQRVGVPGSWEEKGPATMRNYDGIAWYRAWVKVPDDVFAPHERNIWEESVTLNLSGLADAHEAFVNGRKIGAGGQFPPAFQSGRDARHGHKIPAGTLGKGAWNEISLRVYNQSGPGGFLEDAPFLITYEGECVMAGEWEFMPGDTYTPGKALVARPAAAAFDEFQQANRVLGRAAKNETGPRLSPEASLAKISTDPELKAELLLHEPLVAQPTHLSYDSQGRLWVSQYRQYPYPAGVKMISRDKYYRSYYDRVPPPPPKHDRGDDIISIHEDTDGDGVFDRHKVFQDGLNMANAAVRGRGGVWIMQTPYLLFYPDKDQDDIPDGPPEVRLQGFGLEDSHAVANGLVWGPDGWLYGGVGSSTTSRLTRQGMDPPDAEAVYLPGSMVWRYHPETRAFEVFAQGSGNLFGLEFDGHGRLYSGNNAPTTRGWHYIQGGIYLMQGVIPARFGPPQNPYAFGDLPMMRTLTPVRRFAIFGAFAEGTALPGNRQGHLFTVDPLHNEILESERIPRGATFETKDVGRPLWSEDPAFRPVFAVNAPDGSIHVADFYDFYITHGQNYQGQLDPETGRIYRLRGRASALERDTNLKAKTTPELVALLSHPNKWHRFMAAHLLGERRAPAAVPLLNQRLAKDAGWGALGALWALRQMDAFDEGTAQASLRHADADVRLWGVRFLGDLYGVNRGLGLPGIRVPTTASEVPPALMAALRGLARGEKDPEVRSQVAGTARRLTTRQAMALVAELVKHEEDTDDPYIPLMIWWVLEAHVGLDLAAVLEPFADAGFWDRKMVQQHVLPRLMRRYAVEGRRQDLLVAAELLRRAPTPQHSTYLMKGFEEAYRGRPLVGLPDELMQAMAATGQAPLAMRVRQGNPDAIQEALRKLQDARGPADERILYARVFGEVRTEAAIPALLAMAGGKDALPLRKAALISLMAFDHPDIGAWATTLLPKTAGDVRAAVLALLASRATWSRGLLQLVESGQVEADTISLDTVDRIRAHPDPDLAKLVARTFPPRAPAGGTGGDKRKRIAEVAATLGQGAGNPYAGEPLYMQTCASCHRLNFKGGKIGPDLTNYQRDNLSTMLPSIIDPNAEIREGFQYYMVRTKDGRSLSGFLADRDNQIVVLRGLEGEDITLRDAEIQDLRPVGRSLMPEGLLDHLNDQQLRDLFAYLRVSQPITR